MLLREMVGGDPPHTCKLIFLDDPAGFGHRVVDGGRVLEQVFTKPDDFERAVAEKAAEGFAETDRSLSRRVFAIGDRFWIVWLDGDTLRTQSGGRRVDWRESSGHTRDREYRDRDRVLAAYHRAVAEKTDEGYHELYARAVTLAAPATTARKPGKRKSR